jgi:hypothetical protein
MLSRREAKLRIGLAGSLIVVQGLVLVGGLLWGHPRPDYRATYIDHTIVCWLPEPPAAIVLRSFGETARIVPKDLPPPLTCALLPQGWNPADSWGVWSDGTTARVLVPFRPQDRRATLQLRGYAPRRAQRVVVMQDGVPDRVIDIPPGTTISVDIVRDRRDDAIVPITLRIFDVHDPLDTEIPDWRAIGVALIDITRHDDDPPPHGTPAAP